MVTLMADVSASPTLKSLSKFVRMDSDTARNDKSSMTPRLHRVTSLPSESTSEQSTLNRRHSSNTTEAGATGTPSTKITTLSGEFRMQLNLLMMKINRTAPHYIRCIKPNEKSASSVFDPHLVLNQLNCSGVLECIRVTRAGYPVKMLFHEFLWQYRCLVPVACTEVKTDAKIQSLAVAMSTLSIPKINLDDNQDNNQSVELNHKAEVHALCVLLANLHILLPQDSHPDVVKGVEEFKDTWKTASGKKSDIDQTWRRSPPKARGGFDPYQTWRVSPVKVS